MKRLLAIIVIFAMTLSLCGCRKTRVKMLVKEYRSGFGLTGQDFSGYREYEVKNIKEGDVIVGGMMGTDFKVADNDKEDKNIWVMKIGVISDEGVEVTTRESTITRTYGIPMALQGSQMSDGPCYDYVIIFSQ